ncbi:gliding motility-associated C-terminal domain-containing protein [Flavobacterium beibuense]|uniref:CHU_C domain containing protein n=1 Tax=Flavobacterium beibuense TaxID=657326 RepID=A0A444WHY9_9FLAO|nr:gliding motility-associated C-terminal domain-containing protein [Flavobacterium beibuense]RYJ45473.1 CHU_C domain containing protein [Flavobacterium beibuense]
MLNLTAGKKIFTLFWLLFSLTAFAQLPSFTVTATPTAQTCLGNGSLAFSVSGTDPAANIDYTVYLLPDTTTPVGVTTTATLNSLVAGNYLVVATQSLGGESNTASVNVTIADNTVPIGYTIQGTNVHCGNDGVIEVNVTSGAPPLTYEIMSGPVTFPIQSSNVFSNLPAGSYQVRVHDGCGDANVVTYQLIAVPADIVIDDPIVESAMLPSCTTVNVTHYYTPGGGNSEIFFPLQFQFTVYPPGGGMPIIVTQNISTGSPTNINNTTSTIPYYNGQAYSYDLQITDACGNIFTLDDVEIDEEIDIELNFMNSGCEEFVLNLMPDHYMGPYTVTFIDSPAGFVPSDFNASHPVFASGGAFYGTPANPVPSGQYTVQITDACGNTVQKTIVVGGSGNPGYIASFNSEICAGQVGISIEGGVIVDVDIIAAPGTYPQTLPDDVSEYIDDVDFFMQPLPAGNYVFLVTDACGNESELIVEISPGQGLDFSFDQRPGCAIGEGSVRVYISGNSIVDTIEITSAPASFTEVLPFDASAFIAENGALYMNSLPQGNYTFEGLDGCGVAHSGQVLIEGYAEQTNNTQVIPNCGSFDFSLEFASNNNNSVSFWLQKYDEVTDTWGHPETGVTYQEGTQPSNMNSRFLNNNTTNVNLAYLGQFRVIRVFFVFSNGQVPTTRCVQVVNEFTFDGLPKIIDVFSLPCGGPNMQVAVDAEGMPPLTYSITQMNGNPFLIDNGTDNVFTDLAPGTYNFRVTDDCGNFRNMQLDINDLEPVDIVATGLCDGADGQLSVSQFSIFEYQWWKADNPGVILSTTNTLDFPSFNSATDAGTYFVSLVATGGGIDCEQILEYEVLPSAAANAGDDDTINYCNDGEAIDLNGLLSTPHDEGGVWSDVNGSGALVGNMFTTEGLTGGVYEFRYRVTDMCDNADEAVIVINLRDIPQAPLADPVAAVCEGEDIQLGAVTVANAVYEWTGPANFTSAEQNPMIAGAGVAANGIYEVRVIVNGCISEAATVNVVVNPSPDFNIEGDTVLCEGQTGQLTVAAENFDENVVTYQWYFEEEQLPGVDASVIDVQEIGTYRVEVNNNGCLAERTIIVTRNTNAFELVLENGCNNFDYVISVTSTDDLDGATYNWTGPEGFNASGSEIVISEMPAGTYAVEVTNMQGCSATASVNVESTFCTIPRGVSPGDDGYNDTFDLSNLNVQEIKIFNRYGLKVYEKVGYINEWHGQSDKGELPTGTYYYVVTLSAGKQVTGWVYLQRPVN